MIALTPSVRETSAPDRTRMLRRIVRKEWPAYAALVLAAALAIGGAVFSEESATWLTVLAGLAALTAAWTLASLLLRHALFDRSEFLEWSWLPRCLPRYPRAWTFIHSGHDEQAAALLALYPQAKLDVLDLASVDPGELPVFGGWADTHLVFLAGEALGDEGEVALFLRELHRTLAPGGTLVLAEHARGAWGLLAFGPRSLKRIGLGRWHELAVLAGFEALGSLPMSRFLQVSLFRKQADAPPRRMR